MIVYKLGWNSSITGVVKTGGGAGELVLFNTAVLALRRLQRVQSHVMTLDVLLIETAADMESALVQRASSLLAILTEHIPSFSPAIAAHFSQHKCLYRVLEYWGTPAAQNHPALSLRQYLIPYAYNSYNRWLGIYTADSYALPVVKRVHPPRVCLHGKVKHLYTASVLRALNALPAQLPGLSFSLHATISAVDVVGERERRPMPNTSSLTHITNHGVQSSTQHWSDFLSHCSCMLGIGQPYAAPTVLDAIAHGAVYIDYVYSKPVTFTGINPDITLTSQHSIAVHDFGPYAQQYIRQVDWSNGTMLADTLREVLQADQRQPFVHPNYTLDAIANRLYDSLFRDNFCQGDGEANASIPS